MTPVSAGASLKRDRAVGSNSAVSAYAQALTVAVAALPSNFHARGMATHVLCFPFAIGSVDQTFGFRIIRWFAAPNPAATSTDSVLYLPQVAVEATVTVDTPVGIASNTVLLNTERMAKTIVEGTIAPDAPVCEIFSPATAGFVASIRVDLYGAAGFTFDYGGSGSVTSANCLFAGI